MKLGYREVVWEEGMTLTYTPSAWDSILFLTACYEERRAACDGTSASADSEEWIHPPFQKGKEIE